MRLALALAFGLGASPLSLAGVLFGIRTLSGYRFLGKSTFDLAWTALIFCGWMPLLGAFVALCLYRSRARASPAAPTSTARLSRTILVLLLASVPIVPALGFAADILDNQVHVWIQNQSAALVEEVRIVGADIDLELGRLTPGQRLYRRLEPHRDGTLRLTARGRNGAIDLELLGYVTPNSRDEVHVRFSEAGQVEVWAPGR